MIYLEYHIEKNKLKKEEKELNLLYDKKIKLLRTKEAPISRYKQVFGISNNNDAMEKYIDNEIEIEIGISVMKDIVSTRKKRLEIILQSLVDSREPKDKIYYYKYVLNKERTFILKKINYGKSQYHELLNEIIQDIKKCDNR